MNFLKILEQEANIHFIKDSLAEHLEQLATGKKPILIAFCGESASGKTTLVNRLRENIPDATFISTDNYYKDMRAPLKKYGSFSKMVEAGYPTESSEAFQMDILRRNLESLKNRENVMGCSYDMKSGESKLGQILYKPAQFIFVEGICSFCDEVRDMFDVKIYLDVDREIQKKRYIDRAFERGHSLADIEEQFNRVSDAAEKYIRVHKKYADVVVELRQKEQKIRKISYQNHRNEVDKEKQRV